MSAQWNPAVSQPEHRAGPSFRPENVLVARQETEGYLPVEAHIIEPLGAYDIVDLKLGQQFLRARTTSGYVGKAGDIVWAKLDEARTHFFSARTEAASNVERVAIASARRTASGRE